jgi:hypothetical protein
MNNELTLIKRIEILESTVIKLLDKIIILESLNKCSVCNNIKLLVSCINCNDKLCETCCHKIYVKNDDIIYYCNQCSV